MVLLAMGGSERKVLAVPGEGRLRVFLLRRSGDLMRVKLFKWLQRDSAVPDTGGGRQWDRVGLATRAEGGPGLSRAGKAWREAGSSNTCAILCLHTVLGN